MSTQEKDVIKTVKVQTAKRAKPPITSRAYRGTSTCLLYTSPSPRDRG